MVAQRRARVWLGAFAGITAVMLATASGAGAAANFNPLSRTGFISRGQVVSAGGAGALVANPVVAYDTSQNFTETCTWANGVSVQASGTHFLLLVFQPEARYAPDNGNITGYSISPSDLIFGDTTPISDRSLCFHVRGIADDGSSITQTYSFGPRITTLTFFGPSGSFELPFHS